MARLQRWGSIALMILPLARAKEMLSKTDLAIADIAL
jgi:hypothetical protein